MITNFSIHVAPESVRNGVPIDPYVDKPLHMSRLNDSIPNIHCSCISCSHSLF